LLIILVFAFVNVYTKIRNRLKQIYTKIRNRLKQITINDVVFVMGYSKLTKKKQTRKPVQINIDDCSSDDKKAMEDEHEKNEVLGLDVDNLDLDESLVTIKVEKDETLHQH